MAESSLFCQERLSESVSRQVLQVLRHFITPACPPGCCGRDVKLPAAFPSQPSMAERKVTRRLSLELLSIGRSESVLCEVKWVELEEKSQRMKH